MLNSRQKAFCTTALITAASISPFGVSASSSAIIDEVQLVNTLHTHLYPSSKSLPSSKEIKTTAVCFINDTQPCSGDQFSNTDTGFEGSGAGVNPDYDLNDVDRCRKEGYTLTSCPEGFSPEGFCIYNSNYFARCVCPSDYKTCEPPYYGVGQACGDKYASCDCTPCGEGFDYTTIPEGYIQDGEACTDCDGATKYKIKINPCDGFQDCGIMGGDTGATTCMSGSQIKYDNCKPCPNLGTLTSCPSPYSCTYEECSNRYYKSGCKSGYDWNPETKTCTLNCDSYKYTCNGTYETGGSGEACNGKYKSCSCETPYTWRNGACSCDSSYQYTCTNTGEAGGVGTSCGGRYKECSCKTVGIWDEEDGKCTCPATYRTKCTGTAESPRGDYCYQYKLFEGYVRYYQNCNCADGYYRPGNYCSPIGKCLTGKETGYILYSDMTKSKDVVSGKTPIGVVVCSYSDGGGQAIALKSIGTYPFAVNSKYDSVSPISNAWSDINSCRHTKTIMSNCAESDCQAAWVAQQYKTAGTVAGDWCLPSPGIAVAMNQTKSRTAIDNALKKVGGETTKSQIFWLNADDGNEAYYHKADDRQGVGASWYSKWAGSPVTRLVRPVIEF